ncbi:6,7-dimethyl-8-ribityllumazine synthase [Trichocoleus sp. DQ-A3]|uniref:6,7-dimethyl-8-ribityllumazine synthase n=1 Tax=Coleofasciculus sp. FACHB-125 TaxID=2692784 RepID=UPI0016846FE8|nr:MULTISPECIES: 6,7-dimethyl-8-ribityllumazine synthase [unclassified Coleofasciculus]MBD1895980.1 6,7-dimethyl-8-ribityllumazine synthase [Coleofasciculus sp. FACHB-129]MBD1902196.1 6,7-dimethyl-8-ribityllumazine synthase [Coleofasciculus sp. FACHB-125]
MAVFEGTFTQTQPLRFAIVIGRFNDLVTTKLLEGCQDCLKRHGIDVNPQGTQVDYAWVPGSFEVPLVAHQLALTRRYDAVICLGAVIRGQTPHFDYVSSEVSKGIANAGFQTGVPIIFGILTVDTMQQALERAGIKSNHGWEYAMNALEMASLMQQLKGNVGGASYGNNAVHTVTTQALPVSPNLAISPESAVERNASDSL